MLAWRINSRCTPIGASVWSNHDRKLCRKVFQPTVVVIPAAFAAGLMCFFLNFLLMVWFIGCGAADTPAALPPAQVPAVRGYPVFFGAMGENLTTRGIDVRRLRIGDRLR